MGNLARERERRKQEEFHQRLPEYEASKSKDFPGFLIVFCPREDCISAKRGRPFVVHAETWYRPDRLIKVSTGESITIRGRSCPYCFRPSRLPSLPATG